MDLSLLPPNIAEWLKTVDINDVKYDYLEHNDHWLTSEWSPNCEQCRLKAASRESLTLTNSPPIRNNSTFTPDFTTPKIEFQPHQPQPRPSSPETQNRLQPQTNPAPTLPVVAELTTNPAPSRPPPPASSNKQPEIIIPLMTPIAPKTHMSTAFVTPKSANRFNDTYTRSTRQSTRKLLNQTSNQDLIDLNETFDLYKSALDETPVTETQPNIDEKRQLSKLPRFGFSRVS